jgi:Tol biopolymer transport system component
VFSRESTEGADLWVLDVDRGVPARFSSRPGTNIDPVWSPDGKEIIFASGPPLQIYRQALGGAAREQPLLPLPNSQIPLDWSRDGHILYEDSADNHFSMWILSAGARPESRRPYRQDSYNETGGRISADGRWVAYQSDESGQYEVYVDAFPDPREKVRISTGGGIMPEWSADGRELFYATPDYKLMSVAIGPASAGMQPSAPRELFALPVSDPAMRPFDLSSDGQRILVLDVPEHLTQSLTLIVNWPALMD